LHRARLQSGPHFDLGLALSLSPALYRGAFSFHPRLSLVMPPIAREPSATLANMRQQGVRSLSVTCELCHLAATMNVDGFAGTVAGPAFGPRMVLAAESSGPMCGRAGAAGARERHGHGCGVETGPAPARQTEDRNRAGTHATETEGWSRHGEAKERQASLI